MRDIDGQRLVAGDRVRLVGDKILARHRLKVFRVKGQVSLPTGLIERAAMRAQLREIGLSEHELIDLVGFGYAPESDVQVIRLQFVAAGKSFNSLLEEISGKT